MSGEQIKLFLVDGTSGGLTTADITNRTSPRLFGDLVRFLQNCSSATKPRASAPTAQGHLEPTQA